MTILGIGVDLAHIPRIAAVISRRSEAKFAAKILSPVEYAQWNALRQGTARDGKVNANEGQRGSLNAHEGCTSASATDAAARVRFLAVRWSVKEAAYKAMYPYARATWKELTYTGLTPASKPRVEFHPIVSRVGGEVGGEGSQSKIGKLHVSVSHDGEYVYASVLAESAE